MIVNTQRLFVKLLSRMGISTVCDVGSMDGADSLTFRDAVPESSIYAFEPNPENFRRMQADRALQERSIQVVPLAATNYDGEAEFFLVEADYSGRDSPRGLSSLYKRTGEWTTPAGVVRVKTTRLDTFLADKCPPHSRLALWIDTEGKAYEVIEGIGDVVKQIHLLLVEVETEPCIGSNQRLYPEVKSLLQRLGFVELATDQPPSKLQFNALFVRCDVFAGKRFQVKALLVRARLRYLLVGVIRRMCPACLRRYSAMRRKASSCSSGVL
jgi:FkbM family methyltransferase